MEKVIIVPETETWKVPKGYTSWQHYWEVKTGLKKRICGAVKCSGTNVMGVLVCKAVGKDKRFYVALLCNNCRRKDGVIEYIWPLALVPDS
jgi:hypothetical protein